MLELDTRTLLVVTALISMGSAVALISLWRAQLKHNGSGFWAAGMSCICIASILISARGAIPDFISLVIANSLYVIGFVLILRGIHIFTGRPQSIFFNVALTPISAVLFYYFNYVEQNMNIRIVVISIAFALTCFTIVLTLLREKNAPWRFAGFTVATVFGLFGFFHSVRGAIALLSPFEYSFMHDYISSTFVFLVGIFILGAIPITLILLVYASLESRFRIISLAVEQSASSIIITDTTGAIDYVNPAFSHKTGYSENELIGKNPRILRSGNKSPDEYAQLWKTLNSGKTWQGEFHNRKKDGQLYWEIASITPVKQRNGEISHDVLTGLPTRRLSMERLMSALSIAKRNKTKVAMMFIDLDGFKIVNDTHGHDTGDLLLKETAVRLCACVREVDTVARVGGDEFWVILTNITEQTSITNVAKKIIKALAAPYHLKNDVISIGASIGIAVYPDHTLTPQALVQLADQTMYEIKQQGKNNYKFAKTISAAQSSEQD